MNKIDEIISQHGHSSENRRMYCLVLFDYYLSRYYELIDRKFAETKHHGISNKAMINFLFICLNSVEEDYGLFEIFHNFKISCGWSHRIIDVSHPDIERLFAMMPGYRLTGHKWEPRTAQQRPKIWSRLEGKPVADFIKDSSIGKYAAMIDRGIDELTSCLPDDCLVDLTPKRHMQTAWVKWMDLTTGLNITQNVPAGMNNRSYEIRRNFTIEALREDKRHLLANL